MGLQNKNVLLVDNEDSFTYNLIQLLENLNLNIDVVNGKKAFEEKFLQYTYLLFSPGPGIPSDFPLMFNLLENYQEHQRILGICLGHQAIGEFFGGKLVKLDRVLHGIRSECELRKKNNRSCLRHNENKFTVGHYHSWAIDANFLPNSLEITCLSENTIMGIMHKEYQIEGLQFHPESIMTERGVEMIRSWIGAT